jgi:hypothetical protein
VRQLGHAIGFATLILLANCEYLVFRNGNARMHSSAPFASIAVADIFAIVIRYGGSSRLQPLPSGLLGPLL